MGRVADSVIEISDLLNNFSGEVGGQCLRVFGGELVMI